MGTWRVISLICLVLSLYRCSMVIDTECQSDDNVCEQASAAGEMLAGEMLAGEMPVQPYHEQSCLTSCDIEWSPLNGKTNFEMGSLLSDDEQPIRRVNIDSFQISKTEITVGQYSRCVAAGFCIPPTAITSIQATNSGLDETSSLYCQYFRPDSWAKPMNCINYCEAMQFVTWLTNESGASIRLASETEWVYSAKNEGRSTYPWGDDNPTCDKAHLLSCEPREVLEVCSKSLSFETPPSTCELIGNLSEWVADAYVPNFNNAPSNQASVNFEETACLEGLVIDEMEITLGVTKGGDWQSTQARARPNNRVPTPINVKSDRIGFRVARPIGF